MSVRTIIRFQCHVLRIPVFLTDSREPFDIEHSLPSGVKICLVGNQVLPVILPAQAGIPRRNQNGLFLFIQVSLPDHTIRFIVFPL